MPRAIWVLGLVSLLMDVSSEMIHSLLPLFMVSALGASAFSVGLIEGLAESCAQIVKVFSGSLSDYLGQRKGVALAGYAMSALAKPLFALAPSLAMVLGSRLLDRVGKGIRGAPRDALVADWAPPSIRGAAFGLRQGLDTVGAFLGPLLAVLLMLGLHGNFRAVFWLALIPAAMCVALLTFGIHEPQGERRPRGSSLAVSRRTLARLGLPFWRVVAIGALFSLARFSEAFLVLRAQQAGVAVSWVPLTMVGMNLVYALCAYPCGKLADRLNHSVLLAVGLVLLIAADLVLAAHGDWHLLLVGMALWGGYLAMTQGLFAAMVAEVAPPDCRASAYGWFNLASGAALLAASALAGCLWDRLGFSVTFYVGAGLSCATLILLGLDGALASRHGLGTR